ncbi:MAG: phage integrase SAM-like domain-containing protein, partial [Alistipes sp.]|nr:phage integrase SAM-like domain-containing protein [Alistipes sp.]
MRHQFKILFYIKKNQPLKNGKLAIICRISIDGESCTFSTHLAVEARLWDNSRKCVRGRSEAAKCTNALLDNIRYALQENYFKILRSNDQPTPYMIRSAYIGEEVESDGIVGFFRRHNQEFEKMVGTIRRPNTLYKYRYVCNHLQKFIYATRGVSDIPLNRVNRDVICEFHNWLATDAKCSVNTVRIYLTALKHIIMLAIACGRINQNPFLGYQLRSEPSRRHFLL